jgi:hypothetical protein
MSSLDALWWKTDTNKNGYSALFVVDAGPSKNERVNRCVNNP